MYVLSVALRVALSAVLSLFEGVLSVVLRLFEDPLEGYFEVAWRLFWYGF